MNSLNCDIIVNVMCNCNGNCRAMSFQELSQLQNIFRIIISLNILWFLDSLESKQST